MKFSSAQLDALHHRRRASYDMDGAADGASPAIATAATPSGKNQAEKDHSMIMTPSPPHRIAGSSYSVAITPDVELLASPSWSSSSSSTTSSTSFSSPSPSPQNRSFRRSDSSLSSTPERSTTEDSLVLQVDPDGPTPYMAHHAVGLDCEMVGVGPGGKISVLARVSVVDYFGRCIYDAFVKVEERVTDYRTSVSGVRPEDLQNGVEFGQVRKTVKQILRGKIVVGHGLENDLRALKIEQDHPWYTIRDSATQYQPFMRMDQYGRLRPRRLRDLVWYSLGVVIQQDSKPHCSLEDARAAMALYRSAQENWEYEMECHRQNFAPAFQPNQYYHRNHSHNRTARTPYRKGRSQSRGHQSPQMPSSPPGTSPTMGSCHTGTQMYW